MWIIGRLGVFYWNVNLVMLKYTRHTRFSIVSDKFLCSFFESFTDKSFGKFSRRLKNVCRKNRLICNYHIICIIYIILHISVFRTQFICDIFERYKLFTNYFEYILYLVLSKIILCKNPFFSYEINQLMTFTF